jgi:hypothetical protein
MCTPDPRHPGYYICSEQHDAPSIENPLDRLAYSMLNRTTFALAKALGYTIDDLKRAHDRLVSMGYAPIPHLSDAIYEAVQADEEKAS